MLDTNKMLEYTKPIKADLDEFNRSMNDYIKGDSPLITAIARHLLKSKGKRIRPAFLFLVSRAADNFTEHSVNASLAIELIHTATLLHDDVVDESDMRRGHETVNSQWTNLISVLMGDYLFAKAFRIMVTTDSMELMSALCNATERVSTGELRQIEEVGNYDVSEEEYLSIIADKTASLFAMSCEAGSILKKRASSERKQFAFFGEKVGSAFQIADDLLDYIGDAETTGKEPGNDVLTGKVTLPLIFSLKKVGRAARSEIISHLKRKDKENNTFNKVFDFVFETGGIDYAYEKANSLCQQGLDAISRVNHSIYYDALAGMVKFTTARNS